MPRSTLSWTAAALAALAALAGAGCSEPRPADVLLVTLDTLRADRLGSYGYAAGSTPHLDALAARGLRFVRAATVVPLTLPAHSSLMTGTFPAHHGVRDNGGFYLGEEARTLAEVLAEAGYRTGGFVGAFVLDSRWGIAQGFDEFFDDFDLAKYEGAPGMDAIQRPGSAVVERALRWLAPEEDDGRPFFAWVHLYDPHTPYEAPKPFRSRFPPTRSGAYDAEIAAADAQVGRLVGALAAAGRLDDTLVVVLSDHGEMLGEHDELTHGFFVYEAAVRIPLLIAGPGIPAANIDEQVRIVDVMPTVLARLGIEAPAGVQGVDLWPLVRGASLGLPALAESWFPRYHYGWSELRAIRHGPYKLIRAPRPELYDLDRDPRELDNLAEREPERAADLERTLARFERAVTSEAAVRRGPEATDPETAERLRALGYLGSSASRRHLDNDRPRGDPKDKIGLYNLLKEATSASALGNLDEAVDRARRALAEDPEIVEAHLLLGNFHRKAGRLDEAAAAYRDALALDPENDEALYSLALAYKEEGRLADALAGLERAAALDPKNGRVIWQVADVHMREGRLAEAEKELLRALELDLDRPRFLAKLGECLLEMGRPAEAERRLADALAENAELEGAHFHLGLAREELGRTEDAVAAYRQALAVSAEAYRASFNLAKLLSRQGRLDEAVRLFEQTVEIRPDFGTGHLYLAKALLDAGDLNRAEEAARRGLAREPEPGTAPLGHFVLADVYSRLGRADDAAREAEAGRRLTGGASP
jgi:arylsulfatase A-like enzyme/Flp pilus assembly protein TadD